MIPFNRYRDGSTFRDWARKVCLEAIDDAGLKPRDIDSVIVASESDILSLQVSPSPLIVDEIGLQGLPTVHIEVGGATGAAALREGFLHVRSGDSKHCLVIGYEQTASRLSRKDVQKVYSLSFDADIEGWTGVSTVNLSALSFQMYCDHFNANIEQAALVSVKNHGNSVKNKFAHKPMDISTMDVLASPIISTPYRLLDCSMISDGAAAVVVSNPEFVDPKPISIRISGSGSATDFVRLGDRPHPYRFSAKYLAASRAYAMAGIENPISEIDVAEVYDPFSGVELQSIDALRLCSEGEAGRAMQNGEFQVDGRLPVNLSGGMIGQGGAPGATGIGQAVTMYRLLNNEYEPGLQPSKPLRRGVIDAHSAICTVSVVHILERIEN